MDSLLAIMQFQTFMPFVFPLDFLTAQEEQKIPNIVKVVHVTYVFRCLCVTTQTQAAQAVLLHHNYQIWPRFNAMVMGYMTTNGV